MKTRPSAGFGGCVWCVISEMSLSNAGPSSTGTALKPGHDRGQTLVLVFLDKEGWCG